MVQKINKNGVHEGDYVKYHFDMFPIEDCYNGSEGTVIEIIDNDDHFVIMAMVHWTNGEKSLVPINNLFPLEFAHRQAA